jgi:hypothetical protein
MRAKAPRVKLQLVLQWAAGTPATWSGRCLKDFSSLCGKKSGPGDIFSQQTLRWLANPNEKSAMKHDSTPCIDDIQLTTLPARFSVVREGRRS